MRVRIDRRAGRDGLHQVAMREQPCPGRGAAEDEAAATLSHASGRLSRYEDTKLFAPDLT